MRVVRSFGNVSGFLHGVAVLYTKVFQWRVVGFEHMPDDPKAIGILAPHTSNWDVWMMYIMAYHMRIRANWLAKDSLFCWPLGWFFGKMGGISIDRSGSHNVVEQTVAALNSYDRFYLAIAPEGTREKTNRWRTGFYHIAMKAKVRIVPMFIDYKKHEIGFGPVLTPSGDIHKDFEILRAFYAGVTPKHPELRSDMVIKER